MNLEALKSPLITLQFGQHLNNMTELNLVSEQPSYRCPLCQAPLQLAAKTYRCTNNHCFDQAKQGYVNLLPVQFKHSKAPGDNKAMVQARRAFLDQGHYQPLIDKMLALYQEHAELTGDVFDAGCGEGFYTHQHKSTTNKVYGVDIAKEAIKIAAKRYQNCHFSVATLADLPFANEQFTWITSVYAPILEQEFTRILNKDGYLLTVTPGEQHLFELKELIYQQAKAHDESKQPISKLQMIAEHKVNYAMCFDSSDDAINLLAMTPFAFKANQEVIDKLKSMASFTCHADFVLRLYKK